MSELSMMESNSRSSENPFSQSLTSQSMENESTSIILHKHEVAKRILIKKYLEDEDSRGIIDDFEPRFIENLQREDRDWVFFYPFQSLRHEFILTKLCEYYRCGHDINKVSGWIIIFYSPTQRLETTISEVCREYDNKEVLQTTEETHSTSTSMPWWEYFNRMTFITQLNDYYSTQTIKISLASPNSMEQTEQQMNTETQLNNLENNSPFLGSSSNEISENLADSSFSIPDEE
ncbi:hypothetical protein RF11_05201 [Thelohanellus kitauei]|uniref:Uncharacterized protein n=1 Tax=Thelohanellus kitauei TaxID=669202 RepID=A0A0C2MLU0_THEKT|nr:hypothetical protein RF11_05201 [Thelohanellus kitauei]